MSKSRKATWVGGVLLALGASACCWLPLALVGLGIGAAGVGSAFESVRLYLMAATVLFLAAAFFFTYRRRPVCADGACAAAGPSRRSKLVLWSMTLLAAASFAFPYVSRFGLRKVSAAEGPPALELSVSGMTCAGCALSVQQSVEKVPGVEKAAVDLDPGRVRVWTSKKVDPAAVAAAVRKAGYTPGETRVEVSYIEVKGMVQKLGIT